MTDTEEVFRFGGCRGCLFSGTKAWDIAFDLAYDSEGAVHLDCSDLPVTAETIELKKVYLARSGTVEHLRLDARDADSNHITSDSVYLTKCNTASDASGARLEVEASAYRIDVAYSDSSEYSPGAKVKAQVAFHTQGQRGFRAVEHPSSLGKVSVQGNPRPTNYNRMTGLVAVENDTLPAATLAAWSGECEDMVDS